VSSSRLLFIYCCLISLLALTVGASLIPLGSIGSYVAIGIAMAKAVLVLWFFMDLRRSPRLTIYAAVAGFLWIFLLLILVLSDYVTRGQIHIFGK
jgi:cytochrome c oxidase subunit 4